MNPEEGSLRPQILDRFGLRLVVRGLEDLDERYEAYRLARAYMLNPKKVVELYAGETLLARDEILAARQLLPEVVLPDEVSKVGLELIQSLEIASLRAEITLFEAAIALAAADGRKEVTMDDLEQVSLMALRLRRSDFMDNYFTTQEAEECEILSMIEAQNRKEN
jgi:magnesium chelatase subunit I